MTLPAAERAWVGIGANLGDAAATVSAAIDALDRLPGTRLSGRSGLWRSAPVAAEGPDFINAVVSIDTTLEPHGLLRALLDIEAAQGRLRPYPNAARTLDLDLLLFGDRQTADAELTLPHPRMHLRAFVLEPLAEIAPELVIPGRGPISLWRARCTDQQIERVGSR